jgi:hypothetical protein
MHNYNTYSMSLLYSSNMFRCIHHHQVGTHHIITQKIKTLKCGAGTGPKYLSGLL